jgi:hypothetical protein
MMLYTLDSVGLASDPNARIAVYEYLDANGWPLLEPGGRPLDRFILAHDAELTAFVDSFYVIAPTPVCVEGGCSVSNIIPAWRSPLYTYALNNEGNPKVLLTRDEYEILMSVAPGLNPPTEYEYGPAIGTFGPNFTPYFPPDRLPPIPDPEQFFPEQTQSPGPGNVAPPTAPVPVQSPTLGPGDAPQWGEPAPSAMTGAAVLRLALLAYALTR